MGKGNKDRDGSCFNNDVTWNKNLSLFGPKYFISMALKNSLEYNVTNDPILGCPEKTVGWNSD